MHSVRTKTVCEYGMRAVLDAFECVAAICYRVDCHNIDVIVVFRRALANCTFELLDKTDCLLTPLSIPDDVL